MNDPILLIFNPASSTIKLGLFAVEAKAPQRFGQGVIELRHQPLALQITEGPATATIPLKAVVADDLHEVTEESLLWLVRHCPLSTGFCGSESKTQSSSLPQTKNKSSLKKTVPFCS
jgi:acetate kinase